MSLPRPLLALTAAAVTTVLTLGTAQLAAGSVPAAPVTTVRAATGPPTDDQLRSALLTATELGPDFTEVPADPGSTPDPGSSPAPEAEPEPGAGASPVTGCDALRALLNSTGAHSPSRTPHQEVEFDGPDGNPMVTESLTAGEPERLNADFAAATAAFADCRSLTFTDSTGEAVTFTVTPLTLGDRKEAPAVRLDGTFAGVRLNGFLGIERLGGVALAFGFFQRDSGDARLASLYYRAAVAKAERTLGVQAGSTAAPGAHV
ncbi:hypothetical protein [Kitasatospora sp. NPDC057541]|uniref:hypothetical protein n=1 Tax=unclassified Kitasatospora TaxID=2633591 RepID=UPI00367F0026